MCQDIENEIVIQAASPNWQNDSIHKTESNLNAHGHEDGTVSFSLLDGCIIFCF
jgi:hypothetical protein